MKLSTTKKFDKLHARVPERIKDAFDKQSKLLLQNFHHPSLDTKKYGEYQGRTLWQARVTLSWRFYFVIDGGDYVLLTITKHP